MLHNKAWGEACITNWPVKALIWLSYDLCHLLCVVMPLCICQVSKCNYCEASGNTLYQCYWSPCPSTVRYCFHLLFCYKLGFKTIYFCPLGVDIHGSKVVPRGIFQWPPETFFAVNHAIVIIFLEDWLSERDWNRFRPNWIKRPLFLLY